MGSLELRGKPITSHRPTPLRSFVEECIGLHLHFTFNAYLYNQQKRRNSRNSNLLNRRGVKVTVHTVQLGHAAIYFIFVMFCFDWTETCQSRYKLLKVDRLNKHPSQQIPYTTNVNVLQ